MESILCLVAPISAQQGGMGASRSEHTARHREALDLKRDGRWRSRDSRPPAVLPVGPEATGRDGTGRLPIVTSTAAAPPRRAQQAAISSDRQRSAAPAVWRVEQQGEPGYPDSQAKKGTGYGL